MSITKEKQGDVRMIKKQIALPNRQKGVGLLEVLVAVLILSIGFLGVAALQVAALNNNNSSMARSMATIYSYTILDALRTDRTAALAGGYNIAMPADIPADCDASSLAGLAADSVGNWRTQIQQNMGVSACGSIACAAGTCTVTIQFDDSRAVGGAATAQVITEVVL